jgi:hypothetical protein
VIKSRRGHEIELAVMNCKPLRQTGGVGGLVQGGDVGEESRGQDEAERGERVLGCTTTKENSGPHSFEKTRPGGGTTRDEASSRPRCSWSGPHSRNVLALGPR